MDRLRFALLDASHGSEHTRRNFRRELAADLAEFDAVEGHLPATYDFDGVVITGSSSSVYADEDWIAPLLSWVREADARGTPILGVCYGHQAVAQALGGTVEDMGEFELGYREIEHRGGELFAGVDSPFLVFTSHGDHVTELPPGADLLAENGFGVHAFRRENAFGVQFHPEYDAETARKIAREKDAFLDSAYVESVLSGVTPRNVAAAQEVKQIFENFYQYARRRATPESGRAAADD